MATDFFAQQQSALRTGLQMGQADRLGVQRQKEFETQQKQAELDYQTSMQQALQRNILSDTAILLSMDEESQNKLLPSLQRKYRGNETLAAQIDALQNKPYKERMTDMYELMAILQGKDGQGRALSEAEKNFQTLSELEQRVAEAEAAGDQALLQGAQRQLENFRKLTNKFGVSEQEKADIRVEEAGRKEASKSIASRTQGYIDSGIDAADGVANIKRAVQLLDAVETSGFADIALRAKQFFGVDAADEGELSALLGQNVLQQLEPIFGAAFTAAEGDRLERISARFGRSPETNKRLLEQVLKTTERAARRGIAAAERAGDDFTANEIREALKFTLEPLEPLTQEPPAPAANKVGRFTIEVIE